VLASHRQEHTSDVRIFSDIFVERLPDELAERQVILRLAAHLEGVTDKAAARIDEPPVLLSILGRSHPIAPEGFGLELRFDLGDCLSCR